MKFVVAPSSIVCAVFGVIVPLPVTLGVTVCVATKLPITVQFVVTAAVVKVLPASVPPQVPVTFTRRLPAFAASVKFVVAPLLTVCGVFGVIVPLPVTLGVTVKLAAPQLGNLNDPMRVLQLKVPPAFRYSVVNQNVQSSVGSIVIAL